MRVNALIHKSVLDENIRIKKENEKLLIQISNNKYRVNRAASIVNRFYKMIPILEERKGAFRFDKWQEIEKLMYLTEKHESDVDYEFKN